MSGRERLPQDNPYTREVFELLGLQLHVHEMHGMAQQLDNGMLMRFAATERSTDRRNVIIGYPKPNRPPEEQVIPMRHERVALLPSPNDSDGVQRVIVRLPLRDVAERRQTDREIRNAFIEIVSDGGRELLLLNGDGLWRYRSAADIYSADGKEFQVLGETVPEPSEVVNRVDRYITGFSYEQQTNFDSFD